MPKMLDCIKEYLFVSLSYSTIWSSPLVDCINAKFANLFLFSKKIITLITHLHYIILHGNILNKLILFLHMKLFRFKKKHVCTRHAHVRLPEIMLEQSLQRSKPNILTTYRRWFRAWGLARALGAFYNEHEIYFKKNNKYN
jgi:hypothetical protein